MALPMPSLASSSSSSTSSSSSSISHGGFEYDVFLSFSGSDTRYRFTGNLYKALRDKGIRVFFDDREIKLGDAITPTLVKAIKESRIAIPVFSINYASSAFCLDELVHIMKTENQVVLPVFFGVDPGDVRHQTGSYAKALADQETWFQNNKEQHPDYMERMQGWRTALKDAADSKGGCAFGRKTDLTQEADFKDEDLTFRLDGKVYEYEFIARIVEEVSNRINRVPLHDDHLVGMNSRVKKVKSLLDIGSNNGVLMVGIHGLAGIGKSALARAIYNSIAHLFEGLCFLKGVREKSDKGGLVHLQETLLRETLEEKDIKLGSVHQGIPIIKKRLAQKKVLLILDDVDKLEQLQAMAGGVDWFGRGSRVIVTTRDKELLASQGIKRENTCEVGELNREEALELLRWKAFKTNTVDASYDNILNRAEAYASRLPLALEVVGSNLFGKPTEVMESMLDMYERIPHKDIQNTLEASLKVLPEEVQSVFLDIACCLKGYELAEVEEILYFHYGYCVKHHIRVLVGKSLIKISQKKVLVGKFLIKTGQNEVTLHDLVVVMGKEVVRLESMKEPGKRSRLWFHEDIIRVLKENKETSQIEMIYLDSPSSEEEVVVELKGDAFKKMENLKTLVIKNGRFSVGPVHLPNDLRVLEWRGYPLQDLPLAESPNNLSICKLGGSCLTFFELSSSLKRFVNLRDLNFDGCQSLTKIPSVSDLPNLEKFSFERCHNLTEIDNSVGLLKKLKILNAYACCKLRSFPPLRLTSLEELELSNCHSLKSFPEILEEMENITKIVLEETFIKELPSSIEKLTHLRTLEVRGHGVTRLPSSILMMPQLSELIAWECQLPEQNDNLSSMVPSNVDYLRLSFCELSNESLPTVLKWFANVTYLDLSGNGFTILYLEECHSLMDLTVDGCKRLREIRGVLPKLKYLSAQECECLTSSCRSRLLNQELHKAGGTGFCFPGTETIPKWFEHQSRGPSISFWFRNKLPSVALFIVSKSPYFLRPFLIINGFKYNFRQWGTRFDVPVLIYSEHTYLFDLQLHDNHWEFGSELEEALSKKDEWNLAQVKIEVRDTKSGTRTLGSNDLKMGIQVFKKGSSTEDIVFTNPYKKRKIDNDGDGDEDEDGEDDNEDEEDDDIDIDNYNDDDDGDDEEKDEDEDEDEEDDDIDIDIYNKRCLYCKALL